MNSKINGNHPDILRHALLGLLGALSAYYEDEIDVPYQRTKELVKKINEQFNLNIDVDAIFIEPEIPDDGGCGHDYNEAYYDSELDRL
jgi:hypothetical protein